MTTTYSLVNVPDLWELVNLYSPGRDSSWRIKAEPQHIDLIRNRSAVYFRDERYNFIASVHLYWIQDIQQNFVLWVPDTEIQQTAPKTMLAPLTKAADCNYNWYKLYLNILAYLTGKPVGKLQLVQVGYEAQILDVEYRPEAVERFLAHYEKHHLGKAAAPPESVPEPVPSNVLSLNLYDNKENIRA